MGMAASMRFTTFSSTKDNVPVVYEGWEEFHKLFQIQVTTDKHSVPLYCPAEFAEQRRLDRNVLHVNFGVIDVDDYDEDAVMDALNYLVEELDLQVLFHTTHRYAESLPAKFKCRIIIPFSRAVEVEEWDQVWHGMNELVNGIADQQCKNPNRIYYFPSCPPGAESIALAEHLNPEGDVLDIDALLAEAPSIPAKQSFIPEVDPEKLALIAADMRFQLAQVFLEQKFPPIGEGSRNSTAYRVAMTCGDFGLNAESAWPLVVDWNSRCTPPLDEDELHRTHESAYRDDSARRLPFGWRLFDYADSDVVDLDTLKTLAKAEKKKEGDAGVIGRYLHRVVHGNPIGAEAETVFEKVAAFLAFKYKKADPTQLAFLLEESIKKTHDAGNRDISVEWMAHRIKQAQDGLRADNSVDKLRQKLRERSRIQNAFRSVGIDGRTTHYSKDEIKEFVEEAGLDKHAMFDQWVVRYGKFFYFFVGGRYTRPYAEGEAANAARQDLAPSNLNLFREGQNGPVPLSMGEIVDRYGTIANKIEIDLTAQFSHYIGKTKTLVEAPRNVLRMDIVPTFHECVDDWLSSLTDDDELRETMFDWYACVPLIEEPLCALCYHGKPQTGKSLAADGISRLWIPGGSATPLADIADKWNSIMVEDGCPVMLADESLPQDFRGQPRTDFLRRIVQARSQTLHRKFMPDATVKGCVRVIVAVNDLNKELVPRHSELTNADIAAINERLLCIEIKENNNKPIEVLRRIRRDPKLRNAFFKGDMIAEHVAWLHENREVTYGPRFLVEGMPNSELEMELMTSSGLRSEICHFLARFLIETKDINKVSVKGTKPVVHQALDGSRSLLITAETVHNLWSKHIQDGARPAIGLIERALGGISERKDKYNSATRKKEWYREIDLARVKYWTVSRGIVTSEEGFDDILGRHGLKCRRLHIHSEH